MSARTTPTPRTGRRLEATHEFGAAAAGANVANVANVAVNIVVVEREREIFPLAAILPMEDHPVVAVAVVSN